MLDYQRLFEASPDVLLVLRPDAPKFTMVAATDSRLVATHTTREATLGRGLFEVFPDDPDDPTATGTGNLRASLERVITTKAADTMAVQKYDIRGPDGAFEARYWSPKNIPVIAKDGEVRYILHRVEDVTELVRTAGEGAALKGRAEEMEREVIARSRELATAIGELRSLNRDLESFSYSISHDLRAPLRHMVGFAEVLQEHAAPSLDDEGRLFLGKILAAGNRMDKLIEDLLAFARLGQKPLSMRRLDLNALVHDVRNQVVDQEGANRAVLWKIGELVEVVGDPALLRQVFVNLLSNALKYSAPREISEVEVQTVAGPMGEIVVSISDNGVGFDMAQASRLFGVFQRLHRASEFPGTGIGLAIAKRIIEKHGGRIRVESVVDLGTTFFVSLPGPSATSPHK